MKYQAIDRFEYKYVKLRTTIFASVNILNDEGKEGWELIELTKPIAPCNGDVYRGLLKRKITEIEV